MGQVRVLSESATPIGDTPRQHAVVMSILFSRRGAVLFRNERAQQDFAAPKGKRPVCALVRHFADPREGRHLLARALAGETTRVEALVHTRAGIARRLIEISPMRAEGGEDAIVLNERPIITAAGADGDAEQIRIFAQAGADWFWETDANLRITMMSDRPNLSATSLTADFIGRAITEPLPGIEDFDYAALRRSVERREFIRDLRYIKRGTDGRRRHYSVSGAPFFALDGTFRGYRGTGRDRTRSVAAEEQAALAQANLLAAIESIPEGFILTDGEQRLVLCNTRFREQNAPIADQLQPGAPIAKLVAAAQEAGMPVPTLDYILDVGSDAPPSATVERKSGDRWYQLSVSRLPEGTLAVVKTDITALKQREAELAEKSALLRATLDSMHQGLLVNDSEARVVMWNQRFLEMNGLQSDMIRVGMPASELVRAAALAGEYGQGGIEALTAARLEQLPRNSIDSVRVRPDGSVIEHHTNRMPGGMVIRTFTDVTGIKEQERRGEAQRRLLAATLDNMEQGMLVLDPKMRIRLWNPRLFELMQMPESLCHVGMTMPELIGAMRRHQGKDTNGLGAAVAEELRPERESTATLRPDNFGGRTIERRRRPLPDGGMVLTYTDMTEARARESEIAEKSMLLSMVLENMDQGIMVLDPRGNVRMWNERVVEQYRFPAGFLRVGMPSLEVVEQIARQGEFGPGDPTALAQARVAEMSDERQAIFSRRLSNGRVIERRRRDLPDGGTVLTHTDITALSERERALDEKSTHLSAVLASMDQGILVLDGDANIRTWNQRAVELLDLPQERLRIGMSAATLMRLIGERLGQSEAEVEHIIETRLAELRSGEPRTITGRPTNDRFIERRSQPMPDGGIVVTYSDITERKRRENVIAENAALLGATLDNIEQGLVVLDPQHRIKLWNNRMIEMFGLPPQVMEVGRPFAEVLRYFIEGYGLPPDEVESEMADRLLELTEHPIPWVDRVRPDGRVIERRRRLMPSGGSVITYGDVTTRKRGEAALQRAKEEAEIASRSKTEFLANMSHELRTPLNAIIGFSDILMRELFGPIGQERYAEYARDIHASGQHLLKLINDVLDISKIEVNMIDLAEEVVDVAAVVDSCLRLMRDRATVAGVTIAVEMPERPPTLHGDGRRLKQILLNLVSNAVKFTPAGGRVVIRVKADESGFRFIVADTGIGIAKSDVETALRPFGQIDSSLARRYEGTGLGLPLARSMAELHGGRLDIESEPGTGTTVTVWLPPGRTK
jgi:signal transduction histidine kinase/chorismate-pyruvate lyase